MRCMEGNAAQSNAQASARNGWDSTKYSDKRQRPRRDSWSGREEQERRMKPPFLSELSFQCVMFQKNSQSPEGSAAI